MFITDREHLALKLNIPLKNLTHLLYIKRTENSYSSFNILKKNGTARRIDAPNDELKSVQRKLAQLLYKKQQEVWTEKGVTPNISHGFEKGKTIISNAKIHRNKRFVLNLDLENFFPSFHFGRVMGYFEKNESFKLERKIAATIAQLTCYNGSLPQGAPTSPIIANFICQILDFKLLNIAKKYKLDYTRYADDLTFSTNNKYFIEEQEKFLKEIDIVILKSGFKINREKTRLQYKDSRQMVTGLIVNKKINVNTLYFRNTKAMAHSLYTKGEFVIDKEAATVAQLEGRFSFVNYIDKYDNKNCTLVKRNFRNLNFRELEYQRFLFYRLFLCSEKPLIVTEGKTDVIYIKAALKKLYKDYPNLIKRNDDGTFNFKLSFFKRSKKMNYFFGISEDGADSINNLYQYYFGGKINGTQCKNYSDIFKKYGTSPTNPTILIYDNEVKSDKDKPIKKSAAYKSLSEKEKEQFFNELRTEGIKSSNLYLVTNPLVENLEECEIEDLFDNVVLHTLINERTFDRKVEKGDEKHYGKNDFAKYVVENYQSIDFTKFKSILDNINIIVEQYNK